MAKVLLNIPHQRQQSDGDGLAVCASMVLANLGQPFDYDRLLRLLDVQPLLSSTLSELDGLFLVKGS